MGKRILYTLALALLSVSARAQMPEKVPDALAEACGFTAQEKAKVEACLKAFNENGCHALPLDENVQAKIESCAIDDIRYRAVRDSVVDHQNNPDKVYGCLVGLYHGTVDMAKLVAAVPGLLSETFENGPGSKSGKMAAAICGKEFPQLSADDLMRFASQPLLKEPQACGFPKDDPAYIQCTRWRDKQTREDDRCTFDANGAACIERKKRQDYVKYMKCREQQFEKIMQERKEFEKLDKAVDWAAESAGSAVREVHTKLSCFNQSAASAMYCPLVVSSLAGGATFSMAKALTLAAARRLSGGLVRFGGQGLWGKAGHKLDEVIARLRKDAKSPKELASVDHQVDLLLMTENKYMDDVIRGVGANREQLARGMLESDIGKQFGYWEKNILTKNGRSDDFFDVLAGRGNTKAAQAMREIMEESGYKGRSFFNPELTSDQLREVIRKNPILTGYMHEAPGMIEAMEELAKGSVTKEQFKLRIKANLFHNGPNEGFWKLFGDAFVPGALGNGDEAAKKFFKNTVFEGDQHANGVVKPRYPGPVSPEGIIHTFIDRMSQGSRGGMIKIFEEVGHGTLFKNPKALLKDIKNPKGDAIGLSTFKEMLTVNPGNTLQQLKALEEHVGKMANLADAKKKALQAMIRKGQERLQKQIDFINANFQKTERGFKVTVDRGDGTKKVYNITEESSAEQAKRAIAELMKREEALFGNPITEFPGKPSLYKAKFYAASIAGTGVTISLSHGICSEKRQEELRKTGVLNAPAPAARPGE